MWSTKQALGDNEGLRGMKRYTNRDAREGEGRGGEGRRQVRCDDIQINKTFFCLTIFVYTCPLKIRTQSRI